MVGVAGFFRIVLFCEHFFTPKRFFKPKKLFQHLKCSPTHQKGRDVMCTKKSFSRTMVKNGAVNYYFARTFIVNKVRKCNINYSEYNI
jgi:hypothetical protein